MRPAKELCAPRMKERGKEGRLGERESERELTCLREVQRSPLSVLQTHLSPTELTQNSIWNISPSLCSHSFLQLILSLLTPCSIKDSGNHFHYQYIFNIKTCLKQAWKKYIYIRAVNRLKYLNAINRMVVMSSSRLIAIYHTGHLTSEHAKCTFIIYYYICLPLCAHILYFDAAKFSKNC